MPRRVLHVLSDSNRSGSGMARIVASLHSHIDQARFQISACFVGMDGPLVAEFRAHGIPTRVIAWKHPSRDLVGALRFAAFVFSERFDIIHFHWGGPTLRRIGKTASGAKVVFHLHSAIEENLPSRPEQIDTRNSDAVIAVSRAVAVTSSHPTTRVIHPGIEIPADNNRLEDPNLCGCALRLAPIKGVSHLLQAIALLSNDFPKLRLQIAGDGPARPALQAQTGQLSIADRVEFLGWIDSVGDHRRKWTLLIQPSLEDGLPLSVVEAMAEGIPVVASRVGGLPELVADGETGVLVPPASPPALAEAIASLLRDADLRKRLGAASIARVQEHFSAQRMAEETAALYRELLDQ